MKVHHHPVLGNHIRQPQRNDHLCHLPIHFFLQQNKVFLEKMEKLRKDLQKRHGNLLVTVRTGKTCHSVGKIRIKIWLELEPKVANDRI